jgi:hypothetical protein
MKLNYENAGQNFTGSMSDIAAEIKAHGEQFRRNAVPPVVALPQGPMEKPLRIRQVSGPGTPLVSAHPSLLTKG